MPSYLVERSAVIGAPPEIVHGYIDDFHAWPQWSPFEGLDPDLERDYSGPAKGVGSRYAWSGNRKAGRGSMEIVSDLPQEVRVDLEFLKPIPSRADLRFTIAPAPEGTTVTWSMAGEQTGLMGVVGRVVSMDRLMGKDFERGLRQLTAVSESAAASAGE